MKWSNTLASGASPSLYYLVLFEDFFFGVPRNGKMFKIPPFCRCRPRKFRRKCLISLSVTINSLIHAQSSCKEIIGFVGSCNYLHSCGYARTKFLLCSRVVSKCIFVQIINPFWIKFANYMFVYWKHYTLTKLYNFSRFSNYKKISHLMPLFLSWKCFHTKNVMIAMATAPTTTTLMITFLITWLSCLMLTDNDVIWYVSEICHILMYDSH